MKGKLMNENIEKAKKHLKENHKVYIGTSTGFVVGIAASVFVHNNGVYNILNSFNFNWKSTNIGINLPERLGHPGWIIRCLETDDIFPSQNNAAKSMGLNPRTLSAYLNGKTSSISVSGFTFERICEAKAAA